MRFLQNLAWERESQIRTLTPNFAVVAFKMWVYSPKIAKNGNFWYKFARKEKLRGATEKVEYGCTTVQTSLYAMTP